MLALVALVCFVLAAFGVSFGEVELVALGLAFLAAHLVFAPYLPDLTRRG